MNCIHMAYIMVNQENSKRGREGWGSDNPHLQVFKWVRPGQSSDGGPDESLGVWESFILLDTCTCMWVSTCMKTNAAKG